MCGGAALDILVPELSAKTGLIDILNDKWAKICYPNGRLFMFVNLNVT